MVCCDGSSGCCQQDKEKKKNPCCDPADECCDTEKCCKDGESDGDMKEIEEKLESIQIYNFSMDKGLDVCVW